MNQPNLVLRTCRPDMTSHSGFVWPREGRAAAPDWDPRPECGNGLHGLLCGQGDAGLLDWSDDAVWMVVEPDGEIVNLSGKVKFSAAEVLFAGDRAGALLFPLPVRDRLRRRGRHQGRHPVPAER